MAGFLQNLLRRLSDTPAENHPAARPSVASTSQSRLAPALASDSVKKIMPPHKNGIHNGKGIELPLQPIITGLPLALQPRLKHPHAGALTICVPLEKILAQLSSGVVKISFGELREAAPDLFTSEDDQDRVLIPLPLAEVLTRLNPALIMRRREQKLVEVPAEIHSPFERHGQGLAFSVGLTHPETPPPAPQTPRHAAPPPPPALTLPPRSSITFSPTPLPPAALPLNAPAMSPASRPVRNLGGHPPPAAPVLVPAPENTASALAPIVVSLPSLAEAWPEAVRKEIVQLNLVDAKVALPAEVVEHALKQGRVAFTWKALRSWIRPAPLPAASMYDTTVLELPLKIVAPLFLTRQHEAGKAKRRVAVDDAIPNLFFGLPQPESGSPRMTPPAKSEPAKSADTNFYVWDDSSNQPQEPSSEAKPNASPGIKYAAKYATPNEVVSRAAGLDGVAGTLIALPDGLMVSSRLSADLNGDTLAAFLPQIFGKVNQCTKELRMGELNNLNFTVGNVPWKIFRVNAIFFAAFGRAGEPLPTAQLAALAAELDHKPK